MSMAAYFEIELRVDAGAVFNPHLQLYLRFYGLDYPAKRVARFVVVERGVDELTVREFDVAPELIEKFAAELPEGRRVQAETDTSDSCALVRLTTFNGTFRSGLDLELMAGTYEGADAPAWKAWFKLLLDAAGVASEPLRRRLA